MAVRGAGLITTLIGAFALASVAMAQTSPARYPDRPITLVIPFTPGGSTDTTGRMFAHKLTEKLGQSVVVEYKPGANTMIGGAHLARSKPDGYTFMLGTGQTAVTNAYLYRKVPYDTEKDIDVISMVTQVPLVAQVSDSSPISDLDGLIAAAKAQPGQLTYGTIGLGSTGHLAIELLKARAGINLINVPYKGSAGMQTDLRGGQLHLALDAPATVLPLVQAGRAKAIATTTATRTVSMPNVPTMNERYPGIVAVGWWGFMAPTGLPPEVRTKLKSAIDSVLTDREITAFLERAGMLPSTPMTEAQIGAFIREERERYGPLIKGLGLQLE